MSEPIPLEEITKCPWPEDIWTMHSKKYAAAVPDEKTRNAVSGYLLREGWVRAMREVEKCINRSGLDLSPCGGCGETVICIPDGLAMCEACANEDQ